MIEIKEGYIKRDSVEFREYQNVIAEKCVNNNSLVVLPTGLGKTVIAVMVAAKTLEKFPSDGKIIVLAPTRPLINQHRDSFLEFLRVPEDKYCVLTGKIPPKKRIDLFQENQMLFFTPQTLRNDIVNRKYSLKNVYLVIFDEAHHASGDYPYTLIANEYLDQSPNGTILALTASPGASKKKIVKLCENLHIPVENIHIRARKDKDVKLYLQPMNIYKIGVNLNSLMEEVYFALQTVVEERLQYLSQLSFLKVNSHELHNKIFRKDLLNLNKELTTILRGDGDKSGVYTAISVNAQALILYHMLALVEQQGLDILLEYLEKLQKDSKKKSSSKAVKLLAMDYRLKKIHIDLKRHHEYSPENIIHPKYQVLEKIITEELKQNPNSRVLVFVKLRDSVKNIVLKLKENDSIRCRRFVGQATKSKDDKGLSQKEQIAILDQFKNGMYNVLVSTNVGEEGLDIAECDLVIFYDVVASETRLIQRKGRTARRRKGKVIILYCKSTHDEIYLRIALSKLKKMNVTLKNPIELRKLHEEKVEHKREQDLESPPVREKTIITPEFVEINSKRQSSLGDFLSKPNQIRVKKVVNQEILISEIFPLKFELRNKLENEKIGYDVVKTKNEIIICDKIVIQIYNPKISLLSDVNSFVEGNVKKYKIVINLIDFVDFAEDYENEKKWLKKKFQDYGILNDLQIIPIDNVEELFFVVKNLYENVKKGEA